MKLVIVGGVAGGASAAARARRLSEDAEIILFERGEYVSFANCGLPYYAGDVIKKKKRLLVQTPEGLRKRFNIDVRIKSEVISIDREAKLVTVRDYEKKKEYQETYDCLILSPGAEPIRLSFEGASLECVHTVRTVPDIERIKEKLDAGSVKRAVVIGAGFIGIEMAENLRERGIETHLIEKMDQVMPPMDKEMAVILHRELGEHDIRLHLDSEVTRITVEDDRWEVILSSERRLTADLIIMAIGVYPEIQLARDAGLETGKKGIVTDKKMRTSDGSIFAIGDVVESEDPVTGLRRNVPLAGPAAKQALVAVNTLFGIEDEYKGTLGTSIVKVFNLTAAMTGASEKTLRAAGVSYEKVYTFPADHVGYYPGATQMALKLLYGKDSGIVLGAQIVGRNGIARRADILAVAVKQKMTVRDLAELELCYAPPYGSSKDAVNLAGMTALNHIRGITELVHWEELSGEEFLLDVRTAKEHTERNVPNSVNIPVDEIRERLPELPSDKEIIVFCHVGIRAHIACRILSQRGYKTANISGGYLSFLNSRDAYDSDMMLAQQTRLAEGAFCTGPTGEPIDDNGDGRKK
ncbi:MAG: FAD-dependent oxidoreductase [Candidatus Omnitrophica bacterium]|nr:FAD-dependent oxidoreductase [Candidatus Omnitrophota bacterium]